MEKVMITPQNTENENPNPILAGIPVELEVKEEWRKVRYSCSGAGRIEKNFDIWHLTYMKSE